MTNEHKVSELNNQNINVWKSRFFAYNIVPCWDFLLPLPPSQILLLEVNWWVAPLSGDVNTNKTGIVLYDYSNT